MAELTGRIVTPEGVVDGVLVIDGERIAAVNPAAVPDDVPWLVPGFVDIHCHGGGGHTFTIADAAEARAAAAFHARHGTTTMLASLVSSPRALMLAAVRAYAPLVEEGVIAGVHCEGPYLAEACRGAQNAAFLRNPSLAELRKLIGAGRTDLAAGHVVRMMTIAPERRGAIGAIRFLADAGIVVALGHTDATYEQVKAGIDAGATVGTHVFNGMRPPHHRAPGPVYALLGTDTVTCELIADGIHLAEGAIEFALKALGPARAALITDAIAAAGMPDGDYELGGQPVHVAGGTARLMEGGGATEGAIAGSTLTMDAAFRRVARLTGSIVAASVAASTTPARALGMSDRGVLAPGLRADVVTLSSGLSVTSVLRGGIPVNALQRRTRPAA